ncbi:hypothetical protein CYMTET_15017 [Cymbomonas tetramitiformis]|uniref:Reverse transcriptase domain-containing protein n=1 Tax=Cymbomonas tetramitiformis TaxID=36881 RepID=A0AAE0GEV1_9CHLO|nr:hypothetical protein CYMTET_15017 [Cymbomonas tetramitiformis]
MALGGPAGATGIFPSSENKEGGSEEVGPKALWVRVALDCRGINELSLRDRTPPRLPENLFHDIGKDQCISRLDLRSGFHQILLTEDASRKTCFWWAREGAAPEQYVYKRMPFGCTNSTAMFCRVIEHELRGFRCAKVYCDDILITSPTARDHIKDVADVIERLNKVGLRGHPGKSVFAATDCEFLGFLLRPGRLSPHQAKGNENIKELWSREHGEAFAKLKERLTEPGVVVHAYDPSKLLYLMMDWSGVGLSAILGQKDSKGRDVIVAAVSRTLSRSEMCYSSFYGEALAVVYDVRSFRHYLHGVKFILITDHKPLTHTWLQRSTTLTGMHLRWQVSLQEFEYDTMHRSGASHTNADYERMSGGRRDDPCSAEDLVRCEMGEKWSQYLHVVDLSCEEDGDLSLWDEVRDWIAQRKRGEDDQEVATVAMAGLEAWLIAGGIVKQYVYCDSSLKSRRIAEHRLVALHNRFPDQLPLEALQYAFSTFPQDLRRISRVDMETLASQGLPVVTIVGTEC